MEVGLWSGSTAPLPVGTPQCCWLHGSPPCFPLELVLLRCPPGSPGWGPVRGALGLKSGAAGMSLMEGCSRAGDSKSAPRAALAQGPGLPEPGSEGFRVCTVLWSLLLRKSYLKNKHSFRVTLQNIYWSISPLGVLDVGLPWLAAVLEPLRARSRWS